MKIKRNPSRQARRRGVSVVETALILPILMALSLGIVEYGYFFYVHHSVQGAARQGARAGAVDGGTDADINAAIKQAMDNASLSQSNTSYTVKIHNGSGGTISSGSAAAGDSVAVEVEIKWSNVSIVNMTPYLEKVIFPDKVVGSTVMRKEG